MKKVLISGYYGFGNFGYEAILKLLLDKLKDCVCDCFVILSEKKI